MSSVASQSWVSRRKLPLYLQTESAECGLACVAMIANYHGHDVDLASLRRRFGGSIRGVGLSHIISICSQLGFSSKALRASPEYLPCSNFPCIAHWNMNHFVVIERADKKGVTINDPARGRLRLSYEEVSMSFTGVILDLTPDADFSPIQERRRIGLRSLTGRIHGLIKSAAHLFLLAFGVELIALAIPFQLQWTIDSIIPTGDSRLLMVAAIAFAMATLLHSLLTIARGWLVGWLGSALNSQWVTQLFSHLLRLPISFFEKRSAGDILTRFSSIYAIQSTLSSAFVSAVLDSAFGLLALGILVYYSPAFAGIALVVLTAYFLIRRAMFRKLWEANEQNMVYMARQQSEIIESIRGINSIRLAGIEPLRRSRLSDAATEACRRSMEAQRINETSSGINVGIFGIQKVGLLAYGASLVVSGQFTVGMLVASVTFADQFTTKSTAFIDKINELQLVKMHLERLSDIALEEPLPLPKPYSGETLRDDSIRLVNVGFRYSQSDPWILRGLNLRIDSGESVAIVGRSGCGKSTLLKLLLGLDVPSEGHIEIGGQKMDGDSVQRVRKIMSAVLQDDNLFAGTIAENISFFDKDASIDQIVDAAKKANIDSEISSMPMGYESLVGDMGSALSGGQKQRVLLARALFRTPRILVLDEATSHLDKHSEQITNEHIRTLKITRVVVAHRQETIDHADRVIDLTAPHDHGESEPHSMAGMAVDESNS
ncbi:MULTISPECIES: peptidase domain-containing ABC transporter [Xanthomonas]|uniref:peptidase domain-containing ABC transporter n=2 Tax=Xanthomonas TaxID=338 RepID=UPI00096ECC8A|nr:peptidase domain-containing ABC transporter [Xanthomonas campestris]MEA9612623.1 peptidase domain-containing ABC transporter [Xanthomonas campestris pv. incanae]